MNKLKLGLIGLMMSVSLAACSDSVPVQNNNAARSPVDNVPATFAPTPTPASQSTPTRAVPRTTEAAFLLPTATSPVEKPTPLPTFVVRTAAPGDNLGPSLTLFRATKVSFQTAYPRAAAQMGRVNGGAKLVLAQTTQFDLNRTVWVFFFTNPQLQRSWSITYDSGDPKNGKETINVLDRATVLLADDAGQLPLAKILDSDEIATRLQRTGLPPDLALDTVYLQMFTSPKQGRVPAYSFVNGSLNKQIIVNALDGQVLQNDFI